MATSRSFGARSFTTRSPIMTVPLVTSSRPAIMRREVVFPQPDGSDEDEELLVLDVEREVVHGDDVPELLPDVVESDGGHRVLLVGWLS